MFSDPGEAAILGAIAGQVSNLKSAINEVEAGFPQKSASGSIVTIDDGADNVPVVSLTAGINPVQDLHGFDNPWPAGGGKNLLNIAEFVQRDGYSNLSVSENWNVITITGYDAGGRFACFNIPVTVGEKYTIRHTAQSGVQNVAYTENDTKPTYWITGGASVGGLVAYTITASKPWLQISIEINANNASVTNMMVEHGQTDGTWSPYENICPISGWTGANIFDTGVNVWDEEWEQGAYNTSTGEKISGNNVRSKNFIGIIPNTVYREIDLSATTARAVVMCYYDGAKNFIRSATNTTNGTFTTPANAKYMTFYCGVAYGTTYNHDISINYPATDTTYHAYTGRTVNISWSTEAGTVYGGSLVLNQDGSADLTVDKGMLEIQSSNVQLPPEAQTYTNMTPVGINYIPNVEISFTKWGLSDICGKAVSAYPFDSADNIWKLIRNAGNSAFWIGFPYGTTAEQAKEFLTGHQLCYALATPQTYHIENVDLVKTLYLLNNIWADTGDIDLTYRCDPATYTAEQIRLMLNAMVAPVEATTTASKAYSVNDFLILDNVLYKVISPIASGGTITVNTNVSATTVGAELTAILNS